MKPVGVFYATRAGHTERVADEVVAGLRTRGLGVVCANVADAQAPFELAACSAAVLASSVHMGRHERERRERKKQWIILTVFILVVVAAGYAIVQLVSRQSTIEARFINPNGSESQVFLLEVARTPQEQEKGLMYPPDPSSSHVSTIGGNMAENSGGPRGLKYGVTKDYVIGLEVITPEG